MTTVLYRISSGEVVGISPKNRLWEEANPAQFALLHNPTFLDGTDNYNPEQPIRGESGWQKIAVPDFQEVRNATETEIAVFKTAETIDVDMMDKVFAQVFMNDHPRFKKLMKAVVVVLVELINDVRAQHNLPQLDPYEIRKQIKERIKSDFELDE